MTAQTPIYGIKYPVVGEPIRTTRQILEDNAKTTEAALQAGGVAAPGASDLLAVSGRVTVLEAGGALPLCVLRQTTAQNLAAGWNVMSWQAEDFDPDDLHSPTTNPNRVTIKRKGWYRLSGHVPVNAPAGAILWAKWMRNGAAIPHSTQSGIFAGANANGQATPVTSPLVQLNVNDYVELHVGLTNPGAGTYATLIGAADGIGPMLTAQCLRILP